MPRFFLLAATAVLACGVCACGNPGPVQASPSPSPSPSPTPIAGGTLDGDYVLTVTAAPECNAPATTFTFPVHALAANTPRSPGFRVVDDLDSPSLEMELQYTAPQARGGLGVAAEGMAIDGGLRLWIAAIADGTVTTEAARGGEIVRGSLAGTLAFARAGERKGSLANCIMTGHSFALRRP